VIPVEHTRDREVRIKRGGIGDVSDKSIDPVLVGWEPSRVESADYRGSIDEVAIAANLC